MYQITPITGQQWAVHRVENMPEPIEVGEIVPNVNLSRFAPDGKTVIDFSTGTELSQGRVALFCLTKAFCSNEYLKAIVKTAEAFKKLNVKIFCTTFNTKQEMYAWGQQHDPNHRIHMIPDFNGEFISSLGMGIIESRGRHLGFISKTATIFLINGIVVDVQIAKNSALYTNTSAQSLLNKIPTILKANSHIDSFPGSLDDVFKGMEAFINPRGADRLFKFLLTE
ncbi:MAG TPA: redoxin family protein [Rhabdochlamydiaceae bacterium]|nr:redoxin family protein [Rhabdochlamydiaceae bacterium]